MAQVSDEKAQTKKTVVVHSCQEWDTYFSYQVNSSSMVVVVYKKPPRYAPIANKYLESKGNKLEQWCPDTAEKIRENEAAIMERSMKAEVIGVVG